MISSISRFVFNFLNSLANPKLFGRFVLMTAGVALMARFAVLFSLWSTWGWQNGAIPDAWNSLAINLTDHGTFGFAPHVSTIVRGPIFPFLEVPLYLIFGENYAAWSISLMLLDTITCLLLIITVRRIWGQRPALLAGLFYSANLPIIYYTAKISQVTSMLPLVVLWLYLFSRWEKEYFVKWLPWVLGLVSGLMILNKTVYLPVAFICSVVLVWFKRTEIRKLNHLLPIVVYLTTTIGVVAPWTFRNYLITQGKIIPVQGYFWELFVQDVLYYDLDADTGGHRADGELLKYFLAREKEILIAHGVSPDRPANLSGPQWEMMCEKAYADASLKWIKADPMKILKIKLANIWHFWLRAENWSKTRTLILMQIAYLGSALVGLLILLKHRQLDSIKYGLILIVVLWSEHCLVFAWGRFSLDLVPVLGLIFGLGVDTWLKHSHSKELTP